MFGNNEDAKETLAIHNSNEKDNNNKDNKEQIEDIKIIELYDTCESDKHYNENCDHKKLVEKTCVICLEIHDEQGLECVSHSKHINAKCECAYFVHRSCFHKWIQTRTRGDDINAVNCLVCSSEGAIVLSYQERIKNVFLNRRCLKMAQCISNVFCWWCVFMLIWELGDFLETNQQNRYNEESYMDDLYNTHYYQDDISESNGDNYERSLLI
jgi:hypothetical protein